MVNVQELADDLRTQLWVLREFAPDIFTRNITGIDTITDADAEMVRECWVMEEDLGETEYPAWLEDAEHVKRPVSPAAGAFEKHLI